MLQSPVRILRNAYNRAYRLYGTFIAWVVRPGVAPIIAELAERQRQIIERKMDVADYKVTPKGFVKKRK